MKGKQLEKMLTSYVSRKESVLLYGMPGTGKTSIAKAIAEKLEYNLMMIFPVIKSQEDFAGIFVPNQDHTEALTLPISDLKRLINLEKNTVVIIDDLTTAKISIMQVLFQIILERRIDQMMISDKACFVTIANDPQHCMGSPVPEPLKSRFIACIEMEVDVKSWLEISAEKSIDYRVLAYIKKYPQNLLHEKIIENRKNMFPIPSPRAWWNVDRSIKIAKEDRWDEEMLRETICGAIGTGTGIEFYGYMKRIERMTDPAEIYKDPENAKIPEEDDIKFALINWLVQNVERTTWEAVFKWSNRLEQADQFMLVTQVIKKAKADNKKYSFVFNQEVTEWLRGNDVKDMLDGI